MKGWDHFYARLPIENLQDRTKWFSVRYFLEKGYLHYPNSDVTYEKQKAWKESEERPRLTAFTGGNVYFPWNQRHEVLKRIAWDAQSQTPTFWNQIAYESEGMRLAIDIDSTRVIALEEVVTISQTLWFTLQAYYTKFQTVPIPIYVAQCGPRMKQSKMSSALHLIAHVKVSVASAKQLTMGFTQRLKQCESVDITGLTIDDSIIREQRQFTNLRMIYSSKKELCPKCQNLAPARYTCVLCGGLADVMPRFTYVPLLCLLDGETPSVADAKTFAEHHATFYQMVCNYSLWAEDKDSRKDYQRPEGDSEYGLLPVIDTEGQVIAPPSKRRRGANVNNGPALTIAPQYQAQLEEEIRRMNPDWSQVQIHSIVPANKPKEYFVNLKGPGSGKCLWAKKDHGDTRLFFILQSGKRTFGTMYLQCRSEQCKAIMKVNPLKYPLTQVLTNGLFGLDNPPSVYHV